MKKFSELVYIRPDFDKESAAIVELREKLKGADSALEQIDIINRFNRIRNHVEDICRLASIRFDQNTSYPYYSAEMNEINKRKPQFDNICNVFFLEVLSSKYRTELVEAFGARIFSLFEALTKTFSEAILEEMQEESRLVMEYAKLSAGVVEYKGHSCPLSEPFKDMEDEDREVRKAAYDIYWGYFVKHMDEFDEIYDKLVKVRHKMAVKLGFNNCIELAYLRLGRTDYGPEKLAEFRENVRKHISPVLERLMADQGIRLGYSDFSEYDVRFLFPDGNPVLKGNTGWVMQKAKEVFDELSEETGELYVFMQKYELLDLASREGKRNIGYCSFFTEDKAPFILVNFNGSSDDVRLLTHEFGHAYQISNNLGHGFQESALAPLEVSEIFSMGMEFLTWPWLDKFFGDDAIKYKYQQIYKALMIITAAAASDEFQHWVYSHPEVTPKERRKKWALLNQKYKPAKVLPSFATEEGITFFRIPHLFASPMFYIEYALAEIGALQIWVKSQKSISKAWTDYDSMVHGAGKKNISEVLKTGKLKNIFDEGSTKTIAKEINHWCKSNAM